MNPDFDDYDDVAREESSSPIKSRSLPRLVLCIAIAGFLGLTYYAYHTGTQSLQDGQIPYIKAEETELKSAPLETGGEEFANKDKTIYDAISPYTAPAGKKVEKLLPEPEEPKMPVASGNVSDDPDQNKPEESAQGYVNKSYKDSDAIDALPNTSTPTQVNPQDNGKAANAENTAANSYDSNKIEEKSVAKEIKPDPITSPEVVAAALEKNRSAVSEKSTSQPETVKKAQVSVAPTTNANAVKKPVAVAPKPAATGNYKIQLGAFQSEAEASATWQKISSKNADVLRGKSNVIVKAVLANGTYYRLRASGFATADAAKAACVTLTSRKQPCFFAGQ